MAGTVPQIQLPDLMDYCPLPILVNQHHRWLKDRSTKWILEHSLMTTGDQATFDGELLASVVHPHAGADQLRPSCDLFNLLAAGDDLTDNQDAQGEQAACGIFLDALGAPSVSCSSIFAGTVAGFSRRRKAHALPNSRARFIKHMEAHLRAVASMTSGKHG
ncbi:hypothetical protein EYR38_007354 [Pleurotus pulmonarius]|nr:hypothetical protein EYR38_007354 [Pleurotus pulmonarius]